MKKIVIYLIVLVFILLIVSYGVVNKTMENSIIEICDKAANRYDTLPRKALLLQLSDESIHVELKRETIKAIGKMKMESAIPKLERMYEQCDDVGYKYLACKYQLEESLLYLKGEKKDFISFSKLYK